LAGAPTKATVPPGRRTAVLAALEQLRQRAHQRYAGSYPDIAHVVHQITERTLPMRGGDLDQTVAEEIDEEDLSRREHHDAAIC
jgi:hypothetical protein